MVQSLNRCEFIGVLSADIDTKILKTGDKMVKFTILVKDKFTNKDGIVKIESEKMSIVAYKKLAEVCEYMLQKGSLIFVSGKYRTHSFIDSITGLLIYHPQIVADFVQILSPKAKIVTDTVKDNENEEETELEEEDDQLKFLPPHKK